MFFKKWYHHQQYFHHHHYTVHGILQARILEWVASPFSRGSSQPRDWTQVSCTAGGFLTSWATKEAHFHHQQESNLCVPYTGWQILIHCVTREVPINCFSTLTIHSANSSHMKIKSLRSALETPASSIVSCSLKSITMKSGETESSRHSEMFLFPSPLVSPWWQSYCILNSP